MCGASGPAAPGSQAHTACFLLLNGNNSERELPFPVPVRPASLSLALTRPPFMAASAWATLRASAHSSAMPCSAAATVLAVGAAGSKMGGSRGQGGRGVQLKTDRRPQQHRAVPRHPEVKPAPCEPARQLRTVQHAARRPTAGQPVEVYHAPAAEVEGYHTASPPIPRHSSAASSAAHRSPPGSQSRRRQPGPHCQCPRQHGPQPSAGPCWPRTPRG